MNLAKILDSGGRTDMGLKLFILVGSPALQIGVTLATFILSGNVSVSKVKLNNWARNGAIRSALSQINNG